MPFSRKTVGDLGEILTTFFLTKIAKKDVQISWVGSSNLGYDILIPFPDGKVFKKPTAISVKTRGIKWKGRMTIPPDKEKFTRIQADLRNKAWDFWVAAVLYDLEDNELWFKIHLIPSDIIKNEWFVEFGKERQISLQRIKEESKKLDTEILTFTSKSCSTLLTHRGSVSRKKKD